jgi:hypothetical protein
MGTMAYMPCTLVDWLKKQKYTRDVNWRNAVVEIQCILLEAAHSAWNQRCEQLQKLLDGTKRSSTISEDAYDVATSSEDDDTIYVTVLPPFGPLVQSTLHGDHIPWFPVLPSAHTAAALHSYSVPPQHEHAPPNSPTGED